MLWIITEDKINKGGENDCPSRVGKTVTAHAGRLNAMAQVTSAEEKAALIEQWKALCNFEFRLFDDDGEHYYSGVCRDLDLQSAGPAFAPLDWAMNDAGCTRMDYRKKGEKKWQVL